MTHDVMPDFADALEERLRDAAAPPRRRPASRWLRRLALPAVACVALAGALLLAGEERTPTAYGRPLVLRTPPAEAADVVRRLERGVSAGMVFGKDVRLSEARAVPFFGGTAYVVTGPSGWCLAAPDPSLDAPPGDPLRTSGVTCARTEDVYRYGISLGVGKQYIVALPAGAKRPTLAGPDGSTRELEPSEQGVVLLGDAAPRSVLTLYGPDGSELPIRVG